MSIYNLEYFEMLVSGAESLDLNGHLIGDVGATFLATVLKKNRTVSWIDIQYNRIGPAGAKELASAWKCNNTITDIHMNGNVIKEEGAQAIVEALRINRSIVRIFGVYLRPAAKREFHLTENYDYEPVLRHLVDRERLLNLPCRMEDKDRRVTQLAIGITDLPFYIIVSFLSS